MQWDSFDYKVGQHFLPAIINGDYTGLSDDEAEELDRFLDADELKGKVGHWAETNSDDHEGEFGRCDVSGLKAQVHGLSFVFRVEAAT